MEIRSEAWVVKLESLKQSLLDRPIPSASQERIGSKGDYYTADDWSMEILKCLIMGKEAYLNSPPAKYLRGDKHAHQTKLARDAIRKENMLKVLQTVKDDARDLLVCEAGRGIDILLSSMVKKWDTIHCYDSNSHESDEGNLYFKEKLGMPISFVTCNTGLYKFADISRPTIAVANHTMLGRPGATKILNNKNIIHLIKDGRLIKKVEEW